MPYLPSELWLHILSYTDCAQDLWRNVRRTNRQLRDCVEQHFRDHVVPTIRLELSFGLPCYDARNPLRGKAAFHFASLGSQHVICTMVAVEPEEYVEQFLVRWDRLKESHGGSLPPNLEWRMEISTVNERQRSEETAGVVILRDPLAFSNKEKTIEGSAVSFEWRWTLASFFN